MNSKLYQNLMILPMYLFLSNVGVFNGTYLDINNHLRHTLSPNIAENNDKFATNIQIISARDDQNDNQRSCLREGKCTQ
ncbi:MAG: hypothetical protein F6K61_00325 [Sphaerospermopsis sp. SIO1G1]|nr:hypothetical protein [Sphaerospermopsis sp. SIO1G1]